MRAEQQAGKLICATARPLLRRAGIICLRKDQQPVAMQNIKIITFHCSLLLAWLTQIQIQTQRPSCKHTRTQLELMAVEMRTANDYPKYIDRESEPGRVVRVFDRRI